MNRLNDLSSIEARLLELAHTTDARITAPALAYFAPCSMADAQRVLDDLSARGQLHMDVQDDGSITYEMLGRQKLAPARRHHTLRREVETTSMPVVYENRRSPLIAGFMSLWIPGLGQLYTGRVVAALLWFLAVGAGYALILPGLVLHLFCIASAAASAVNARPQLGGGSRVRGYVAAPAYR